MRARSTRHAGKGRYMLLGAIPMSLILGLLLLLPGQTSVLAKTSKSAEPPKEADAIELPADLTDRKIDQLLARMDDDQVRRLLIAELKKDAAKPQTQSDKLSPFARLINRTGEMSRVVDQRLEELRSGARAAPGFLPQALANYQRGKGSPRGALLMFAALLGLFAGGSVLEWIFRRNVAELKTRLQSTPPADWTVKTRRLLIQALIDLAAIAVFAFSTLFLYVLIFDTSGFRHLIILTYLATVLEIRGISLVSRFFLSPASSQLRLVPLDDAAAKSLHNWIFRLALVSGIGFMVQALLELRQAREAILLLIGAFFGLLIAIMLIVIVLQYKKRVTEVIRNSAVGCTEGSALLRRQTAEYWHLLAIPYIIALWGVWVFYLFLGRLDMVLPILAFLACGPLYMLLNFIGQKVLDAAFLHGETAASASREPEQETPEPPEIPHEVVRYLPMLRAVLSLSIAVFLFFWLLRWWGFEIHVGEAIARAVFDILVTVSLAYVAWKLTRNAIDRKLLESQNETASGEHEEMGPGGNRQATLLQLLRKFLFAVIFTMTVMVCLSALGVDIGPLMAGAGVVGLAIGFGAQTLVKDIVAGIFFLIDDAFRIGDYVDTGKVKGTVEQISIRSLRLRHHRGMLQTVPFGDLGAVTNYSRDYIVMKLEFRVPYGTDVDQVRKIVKKINKEIQKDEELGPQLLDPIKSQGVKELADSYMIMRIKFKTVPGGQFMIRKKVFVMLQEAFEKKGIEFARRQVAVYMPDGGEQHGGKENTEVAAPGGSNATTSGNRKLTKQSAAALAQLLDEEEQAAREKKG